MASDAFVGHAPSQSLIVTDVPKPPVRDNVNCPSHYTSSNATCPNCGHRIECIDITRHMGFSLGNAVKYVWRCDLKNNVIEDLRKAVWYIQDEIDKREKEKDRG